MRIIDCLKDVDYSFLAKDEISGERIKTSEIVATLRPDIFISLDRDTWEPFRQSFKDIGVELCISEKDSVINNDRQISTTSIIEQIVQNYKE